MSTPAGDQACPFCGDRSPSSRFDLAVLADRGERLCFGVPATMCRVCGRLVLAPDVLAQLGIDPADVIGGIESDSRLGEFPGLDAT